jgi:hypothetical protein
LFGGNVAFLFQVKIVPLDPKEQDRAREKTIGALSRLQTGMVICAEVYENSINGFENRLLVVTRKFDLKTGKIGLAGIPDLYANRPNYPKMPRLIERDVSMEEIGTFDALTTTENIRIGTKNGEEAVGRFFKANLESGYPGIAKLEIVLVGGTEKKPVQEIIEISDICSIEFVDRTPAKKEVFASYEFR